MLSPQEKEQIRQHVEKAREATTALRDAARMGRVVHFRERDKYVAAIHRALDLTENYLSKM